MECMTGLKEISPWLTNIHVFYHRGGELRSLVEGKDEWTKYIDFIKTLPGDRFCLLEFVRDEAESQFFADATTLINIINPETRLLCQER
jgi:hypothetical protein